MYLRPLTNFLQVVIFFTSDSRGDPSIPALGKSGHCFPGKGYLAIEGEGGSVPAYREERMRPAGKVWSGAWAPGPALGSFNDESYAGFQPLRDNRDLMV